ncbi:MAG: hypothetical protein ACI4RA_03385 [Kiritimatiellia bacterium]
MNVTMDEILCFSLLFAVPSAIMILFEYAVLVAITLKKECRLPILIHWIDFVIPIIATGIWCKPQVYSIHTKSMSNIAELGISGLVWGALFLWRGVLFAKGKRVSIWYFAMLECVLVVLLVIFAPTFSE